MSRDQHKEDEEQIFDIFMNQIAKEEYSGEIQVDLEQIDKPDYGIFNDGKRIGVEICSIDNEKLMEGINAHDSSDNNKAKDKLNKAVLQERMYISIKQRTLVTEESFGALLSRKFKKYSEYINGFEDVDLILHSKSIKNNCLWERLKLEITNYCVNNKCPFRKVFLINMLSKKYVGKVFERGESKVEVIPDNLSDLHSEDYVRIFAPIRRA